MNRVLLLGVTAVMVLGAGSASAQQKGPEEKGAPQMQGAPGAQPPQKNQGPAQQGIEKAEPKGKIEKGAASGKEQPGKGAAQTEPTGKATKGAAEKAEPKDKGTKGSAEKRIEPTDRSQGTAEKGAEPKDKATKGAAEKGAEPKDKATKGTAEKGVEPKDKTTKGAAEKGSGSRVQLSEQQRTDVRQTIVKDTRVNRVTNVNVSINVGARVPRSVRLVALPASVIAVVPAYRPYRYFVVDEQVCIVDPATYEIVEIITISDRTVGTHGGARLVLTEEEKTIILSEVDMSGDSTLALGALAEGTDVPRGVQLRVFPTTIVQKVSKVRGYKFFSSENRVVIVDPQGAKVQLVIEQRR